MSTNRTLFQLRSTPRDAFDGSTFGVGLIMAGRVDLGPEALRFGGGSVRVSRHPSLDVLQSFTIEATLIPDRIGGHRRNIAEAQTPPVALFLDGEGKLVGSVHTQAGWISVDSGDVVIHPLTRTRVRMTRHTNGRTELFVNERLVGHRVIPGLLRSVGDSGFHVGAWVDGRRFPFVGRIEEFDVREGVASQQQRLQLEHRARAITSEFVRKTGLGRVRTSLIPDESRARLQPVRDLLQAAGVERLSDLDTLRLTQPMSLGPGQVMVAPRKGLVSSQIDWSALARQFSSSSTSVAGKRAILASTLANRNSKGVLLEMIRGQERPDDDRPQAGTQLRGAVEVEGPGGTAGTVREIRPRSGGPTAGPQALQGEILGSASLSESILREPTRTRVLDRGIVNRLESADPVQWPGAEVPGMRLMSLTTIPLHTAVIIAPILDLTNIELRVEPSVSKLYIIAEEVICGAGARITWRRPRGTTPVRADDPDLNGRGHTGVQPAEGTRDGLHGEDGRSGREGIAGARGADAPHLEMWVKRLTALPHLDLNGEEGRPGGRGQRGGRGGRGADGKNGERVWFFGWHCTSRAGHGGHGGNGGNGGRGGRGGDGGGGAEITIGVLEGTLAQTVTNRSFMIKNQGGGRGAGGHGGPGGAGGPGGRAGIGETCTDAQHGRTGAQGQPGPAGPQGHAAGTDGLVTLFEFTAEAWDELLTRPWISQLVPTELFPGDELTIRGGRFISTDRVRLGGLTLVPTVNADESLSMTIPDSVPGGTLLVFVRRADGTESNRLDIGIKPRLQTLPSSLPPGSETLAEGRAFLSGASVLIGGTAIPAQVESGGRLRFTMPGTGGEGATGGGVIVQIRNPDGRTSNPRVASRPRILEIPFIYGVHNLTFPNFSDGIPSWATFEETFGAEEIWRELLDPVFGHPILTAAYFGFYKHFLKGTANEGLATGFCTSLSATLADRFWLGHTNQTTLTKASMHQMLTAVHGRLLSRESLIHFHDQGRVGIPRVERTAREIEATFLRGCDRHNAPQLFFIPAGAAWDPGYFDALGSSHCVTPYRFVYPEGHPGPVLGPDGQTTLSSLDGVQLHVWDCNAPENPNCRVVFAVDGGQLHYEYFNGGASVQFSSQDGVTLGMMTNGKYLLSDHSLPFSGPLGLTRFIVDFLLSPADLMVVDGAGRRTGRVNGQILSEIPGSHPGYLAPGLYLLPMEAAMTRRIRGTGSGRYDYHSVLPGGRSLALEGVSTAPGQEDVVLINGDATQIRFTPGQRKNFSVTLARQVEGQARGIAIEGVVGAPDEEVDITISPELSLVRLGNRGTDHSVAVKAFSLDAAGAAPVRKNLSGVHLPGSHDLVLAVGDWNALDLEVNSLSFE